MDTVFSSITASCSPSPSPRDSASTGLRSWLYQEAPNVPTNSRLYIHAQGRTRVVLNQQACKHHSTFSIKEVDSTGAISMTARSDHQAGLVLPSALSPTGRHSEVHHVTELAPVAQDRTSDLSGSGRGASFQATAQPGKAVLVLRFLKPPVFPS